MKSSAHKRCERALRAAEGYLQLDLPASALRELAETPVPDKLQFGVAVLRGEAYRQQEQYPAALREFEIALGLNSLEIPVLLSLAWCCKRTQQLPRAIAVTRQALRLAPQRALISYNLACYLSLAGERDEALEYLTRALKLDSSFRNLIPDESDFDPLRHDADFLRLTTFGPPAS